MPRLLPKWGDDLLPRTRAVDITEAPCRQLQLSPTFGVQCDERDVWSEIVHGLF